MEIYRMEWSLSDVSDDVYQDHQQIKNAAYLPLPLGLTRADIGSAFPKWSQLKDKKELKIHAEVTTFLWDR